MLGRITHLRSFFHLSVRTCAIDFAGTMRSCAGPGCGRRRQHRVATEKGPARFRAGPFRVPLLFGSLALLVGLCGVPGTFGLGFLLARVALGVGLVLLGLTFSAEVVAVGHLSDDLLGLALRTLDGALDGLLGPTALCRSASSPSGRPTRVQRWIRGTDCVHPAASRVASTVNAASMANRPRFQTCARGNPRLMSTSPTATTSVPVSSQPAGGIARQELEAEGAAAVFDNPDQLLDEIRATPIAALRGTGKPFVTRSSMENRLRAPTFAWRLHGYHC